MARTLANLDLNLLVTLDALLAERNVTRAAERLGLSQPTVSASLARLRRHFGDDLLSRTGNRYELTTLGVQLRARTATALVSVGRVFDATPDFDPSAADTEFTIMVSDYAAAVLGESLMRRVGREAPGVRLRLPMQTPDSVDHVAETLRTVDGIVLPHGYLDDLPCVDLFEDDWVGLVARDHPTVGEALTLEDLGTLPAVLTYHRPTAFTPAEQQMRTLGVDVHAAVVVESFLTIPFLVAGSNRFALVQRRLAERLTSFADVRWVEIPFRPTPIVECFWWHPSHRTDPAHQWLREVMHAAAHDLD